MGLTTIHETGLTASEIKEMNRLAKIALYYRKEFELLAFMNKDNPEPYTEAQLAKYIKNADAFLKKELGWVKENADAFLKKELSLMNKNSYDLIPFKNEYEYIFIKIFNYLNHHNMYGKNKVADGLGGLARIGKLDEYLANSKLKLRQMQYTTYEMQATLDNYIGEKPFSEKYGRLDMYMKLSNKVLFTNFYKTRSGRVGQSDNDIIYLWHNKKGHYKIGVTSARNGHRRIYDVAIAGDMDYTVVEYKKVNDALSIEKILLNIGRQVSFERKFDGSTEFRHLTAEELETVRGIISAGN